MIKRANEEKKKRLKRIYSINLAWTDSKLIKYTVQCSSLPYKLSSSRLTYFCKH